MGLDPDEHEPLSSVLAAIHCYQAAPPNGFEYLSPGHYFEFTVAEQDHHRIANGFPELQKLANVLGHEIPFVNFALVLSIGLSNGKVRHLIL
jgi:hypothetical protein